MQGRSPHVRTFHVRSFHVRNLRIWRARSPGGAGRPRRSAGRRHSAGRGPGSSACCRLRRHAFLGRPRAGAGRARRGRQRDGLLLGERAGSIAVLEAVRGCDRDQGRVCARRRRGPDRPHRHRAAGAPAFLGPAAEPGGRPAAARLHAAARSPGGQEPHAAGARPGPALVRGLRQLRRSLLQHQARQLRPICRRATRTSSSTRNGPAASRSSRPTCSG